MNIIFDDNSFIDELTAKVDALADTYRTKVVGDPVRVEEYRVTQQQAEQFRDAGFPEASVPPAVKTWAKAKRWTARQAADDILITARIWQDALLQIRDLRLNAKQDIERSTTMRAAQARYDRFAADLQGLMATLV